MMFQGMFQRPRQDFGMRHQSLGERPDFDMGGGMGRAFHRPEFGGHTPMMGGPGQSFRAPQFQTGGNLPPMQQGWMAGGNMPPQGFAFMGNRQSAFAPNTMGQSPLMAMWQRYMGRL